MISSCVFLEEFLYLLLSFCRSFILIIFKLLHLYLLSVMLDLVFTLLYFQHILCVYSYLICFLIKVL